MSDGRPGSELTRAEKMERHNRHEAYAEQVMELYARGESFGAISKATGIPKTTVQHMCKRLAAAYARERYGDTTAILGRELTILDQLTRTNLARAKQGDPASAKIVLDAHIRRSKLLGLDAAVKAEITVRTAQDIEIERLVAMMGTEASGGPVSPQFTVGTPEAAEAPESRTGAHTAGDGGDSA